MWKPANQHYNQAPDTMDDTFLKYYESELDHLRRTAKRFAGEFPKVARRLQLNEHECADPYVERLLEGVAFLTARISRKVDTSQSEFAETLLNQIAPEFTAPIASRAILHLKPESQPRLLPIGSTLEAQTALPGKRICRYTLREPLELTELQIRQTAYDDTEALQLATRNGLQAVGSLRLALHSPTPATQDPRFFIQMPESAAGELLLLLMSACTGIIIRTPSHCIVLPASALYEPPPPGGALSLPPLAEYFIQPEQFAFFCIRELQHHLSPQTDSTVDILLSRHPSERLRHLLQGQAPIITNCVRAYNIFRGRLDRITPSWRPSEHLIASATAGSDIEVLQILGGSAYDTDNRKLFDLHPFYLSSDQTTPSGRERLNYISIHREAPIAPPRSRISPYTGSETFIQLSGPDYIEQREHIASIGTEALCSNRDLPLYLRQESPLCSDQLSAQFAAGPSRPHAPLAESNARWMGIALARLTPSTLASYAPDALPGILRTLLLHLCPPEDTSAQRQISGITAARVNPTSRAVPILGDLCIIRGWNIDITLNELVFGGSSLYLFATSLAAFLLTLSELNSFTEITIRTTTKLIHTWHQQAKKA